MLYHVIPRYVIVETKLNATYSATDILDQKRSKIKSNQISLKEEGSNISHSKILSRFSVPLPPLTKELKYNHHPKLCFFTANYLRLLIWLLY